MYYYSAYKEDRAVFSIPFVPTGLQYIRKALTLITIPRGVFRGISAC